MKHKKRTEECLNCRKPLVLDDNFCSSCGQENTTYKLTLGELLRELFETTFNLNTKLIRSIVPFLFMPGKLTYEFLKGRRKKYIHPVRVYLVMSILFFFVIAKVSDIDTGQLIDVEEKNIVSENQIIEVIKRAKSTLQKVVNAKQVDSVEVLSAEGVLDKIDPFLLSQYLREENEASFVGLNGKKYSLNWNVLIYDWAKLPEMNAKVLLDSMNIENPDFFDEIVASKMLDYAKKNDPNYLTQAVYDNIPFMMFLLLPIFALFLKLLYVRRKRFYVEHLIFALYIHAHVYLMVVIALVSYQWFEHWTCIVLPILIEVFYSYKMFKNVYQQHWFKTWAKMFTLGFMYLITLSVAASLEILVSLLIF